MEIDLLLSRIFDLCIYNWRMNTVWDLDSNDPTVK